MTTEVTYRVYRGNRPYNRKDFGNYEAARNFIRKLVRSGRVNVTQEASTVIDTRANTIPLSAVGFSVRRREDKAGW